MPLLLSALINLISQPEEMNANDLFSLLLAFFIAAAYLVLILLLLPYILWTYWEVAVEERNQVLFPQYVPIVTNIDLKYRLKIIYPIVNFVYRTVICMLLLTSHGNLKSVLYLLMTFFFTCYLAGCKPFEGVPENRLQLTSNLFHLVHTYLVAIAFTSF